MDQESKKQALRMLTCGLYVVAAKDDESDEVAAGTITWMSQASFEPPLIMTAIRNDSHLHKLIEKTRAFGVSIISTEQKEIAEAFFRTSKVEGGRVNGYAVQYGEETDAPIVSDCPAWLEARVVDSVDRGDHTVYVAQVVNAGCAQQGAKALALSSTEWTYGG